MMKSSLSVACVCVGFLFLTDQATAEVRQSAADGFHVLITKSVPLSTDEAFAKFVGEFGSWYDASHSYTGKAENLSISLDHQAMLETLPEGGFVRHLDLAYYQPHKEIRFTGGLGPLQSMGVSGTMAFTFKESEERTDVTLSYVVTGATFLQLDKIATAVDGVLQGQMDRYSKHCGG